jgi:hypothetical protein
VIWTAADVVAAALDELPAEIRSMRQSSPQEWPGNRQPGSRYTEWDRTVWMSEKSWMN